MADEAPKPIALDWYKEGRELLAAVSWLLRPPTADETYSGHQIDPDIERVLAELIIATCRRMTAIIESPDLLTPPPARTGAEGASGTAAADPSPTVPISRGISE